MKLLRCVLALAVLQVGTGTAVSQSVNPVNFRNSPKVLHAFRDIVTGPSQSTVRVLSGGKEVAFGTIVDADGWILTKASELHGPVTCKMKDGKVVPARVAGIHEAYDLAMLQVEARGLPAVAWRDSKEATVGKWVASAGTGTDPVAIGVVSVATRKFKAGDQPPKTLNAKAGWLGIALDESAQGPKITTIWPKSPAQKAGLKVNDIVLKAAGRKIIDSESLVNTIGKFKPGAVVALQVKRGKEDLEFKATLEKRPRMLLGNPQESMGTALSNRRGGFPTILQHDSGLRPEDCGGPLVDLDGKTIGINIARAGRTETYAIPAEEVQALLGDLKSGKLAPKSADGDQEPAPKNSK